MIEALAQRYGVSAQQMLQQLIQMAQQMKIPLMTLIKMLMERMQLQGNRTISTPRGGGGGAPGQGYQPTGPQVQAQPGMNATPPTPHVGPITRPSGIATGRAPGVQRR